ncbi:DUF2062 domain-containing protein [Algicola sagamiensis]|uniref:DUF2062 domain-containing protein n=1 Tax=Algicola sagamiensis TaxID=163869 RepID=UPI000380DDB9|nr:DUF2062 domain-containing protein [Algicola sagamiensis]
MPKKTIKKFLPDHQTIKDQKALKIFGNLLYDANLWHLNRRSARGAFAVGLFFAFVPVPFQMVLAVALAIPLRVNLPISIALVWITNPLTMGPIFYGCYLVGTLILGQEQGDFAFEASWEWLVNSLSTIGPAFLVGCGTLGVLFALFGYFFIDYAWRYSVAKSWKERAFR